MKIKSVFLLLIFIGLGLIVFHFGEIKSTQAASSGAPILVITNNVQPYQFGSYLGEILRAEGFNAFDVIEISAMAANNLSSYSLVILAQTNLTAGQSNQLTSYVSGGGHLIAMRPDPQIKALFGLGVSSGSQNEGYLKILDAAVWDGEAPGQGLSTETLQIHPPLDLYALAGGTTLAEYYSTAAVDANFPAVMGADYDSGRGVAFLYDLPTAIIDLRQGNQVNSLYTNPSTLVTGDVDGDGKYRTIDLFQTVGGGSPWIDLSKTEVPQADIQQRLFGRLVRQMLSTDLPAPQLWYFPGNAMTMLIMTGDAHANPDSYFQTEADSIALHHGHITFYLSIGESVTPKELSTWIISNQYSFGIHPYAFRTDAYAPYNVTNLFQGYSAFYTWFQNTYNINPYTIQVSKTVRNHEVAWAGWTDSADYAASYGIQMDTSFYTWGPWLQKGNGSWAHGYITGSGQPMKFIHPDGTVSPVFQQLTELVDEQMIRGTYTTAGIEGLTGAQGILASQQLIDSSLNGNYEALMTQNHVDYYKNADPMAWAEGTMDYAYNNGIPIWNADQWLAFTQTRYDSQFTNLAWDSHNYRLTFNLSSDASSDSDLTILLPISYANSTFQSVWVDGSPVTFQQKSINGVPMAFISVLSGNHSFSVKYLPWIKADISLSLTASVNPITAGQADPLTFTINVHNTGPDSATGSVVTDTLPMGVSLVSAISTVGTCNGSAVITCDLGTLISNQSIVLTIQVSVDQNTQGTLLNTAAITLNEHDLVPGNNSDSIIVNVKSVSDLSILITAWPEPVGTGSLLTYTLRLSNLGPSTAHDVTVKDTLPVGVNFVSAIGNGWTCADDAGLVTCHSIDLAAGSLTLLKIQVNAPSALGNLVNSVEAATTAIDPVLSNNSAEVNSKVLSFAYLPVIHR